MEAKTPEEQTEFLKGKTIQSVNNMEIFFTDGSSVWINHDCFFGDTIYNLEEKNEQKTNI